MSREKMNFNGFSRLRAGKLCEANVDFRKGTPFF